MDERRIFFTGAVVQDGLWPSLEFNSKQSCTWLSFSDLCYLKPLAGLKLVSLKWRSLDDYKWPESGLLVMESIPNKWYCQPGRRTTTPQLAPDLSALPGRIISQQMVYSRLQRLACAPSVQSGVSL
ncbi:hypothetical protein TNCV_4793521 [Trichonephila clavipes]|nr:hypothetical protein TNCV_4793521 [Trichonephila clavipes]